MRIKMTDKHYYIAFKDEDGESSDVIKGGKIFKEWLMD